MGLKAIAVIEIGTTRTFGVLGALSQAAGAGAAAPAVDILRAADAKSSGIRKGEVYDVDAAAGAVKKVLGELGDYPQLKNSISEVCIVYAGGSLAGDLIVGKETINNEEGVVFDCDIDTALQNMTDNRKPDGRRILEQRKISFILDGAREVADPLDMTASQLTVTGLRTHADANGARAVEGLVEYCGYNVGGMYSAAYCAPLGCLTPEQRRLGALVIDLGAGTTSWSVVKNGSVIYAASLPVGGDHITNDLLCAFRIGSEQSAQELKHSHSSAVLDGVPVSQRIALPHCIGISRDVSLKAVSEVVNARMDEIFQIILGKFEGTRLLSDIGFGAVLCGGGSALKGADTLAARVFGMPCVIGKPAAAGFADLRKPAPDNAKEPPPPALVFGPGHSAALGALSLAATLQNEALRNEAEKSGWARLAGKFGFGGRK